MTPAVKEIQHPEYGKCVHIAAGPVAALITIDKGPRILSYSFSGEENILFTENQAKQETGFHAWGGHRITIAPEQEDSFYPDNEPVTYTVSENGVEFTAPRRKNSGLQLSMELLFNEQTADMMAVHTLKNHAKERIHLGLWSITMLLPGGTLLLPQNISPAEPSVPSRIFAFWPGSSPRDHRLHLGEDDQYIRLKAQCENRPLSLGINNQAGWAAYVLGKNTLLQRYVHSEGVWYPNHGCSFRASVTGSCLQLETFSPLYWLEPGEAIRHAENFSLFQTPENAGFTDEAEIHGFLENLK